MRRRAFVIAGAAAWVSWPLGARSQERQRRVGVLLAIAHDDPQAALRSAALQRGLSEHGWVVGGNLRLEYRYGGGDRARLEELAAEFARLPLDVIVAGGTGTLQAMRQATKTTPIVMVQVADPVANGFVASLERPGGNITGFAQFEFAASSKWVQLLKDVSPGLRRLLVIYDAAAATVGYIPAIEAGARAYRLELILAGVRTADDIERAIGAFAAEPDGGLSVVSGPVTIAQRNRIIGLAASYRLPAIYSLRFYAESGGLMSYSADSVDMYRQAASYVDRILRGANPALLPVQQPTRLELVINLQTARDSGFALPPTLIAGADVILE